MARVHYEDLVEGWHQVSPPFHVERAEVIAFAERWDPQPWHLDEEAAAASIFGGLTACAMHTMAIQSRLSHELPDTIATVAGLGNEGLRLVAPVRPGDDLALHVEFVDKRLSASRPECGIATLRFVLKNQAGETVLTSTGKVLIARREG